MKNKPTLVEFVAQGISITKERKIKSREVCWKKYLDQADTAVYFVLMALKYRNIFSVVGLKKRKVSHD